MQAERKRLAKEIQSIEEKLSPLPPGKLYCTKNGNYQKNYQYVNHERIYIPKSNQQLAEQLAAREYYQQLSMDMQHELNAIDSYLKKHDAHPPIAEQLLCPDSKYQALLQPYFKPNTSFQEIWQNEAYEKSSKHQEHLLHTTFSGQLVRSKSEALIDTALTKHKIAFRYECALHLQNHTIYPDFTILHPTTNEIYYWEHFGMMDSSDYRKGVSSKLNSYISNGIMPSVRLITTYETRNQPLSTDIIEKLIEMYFLHS